MTPDSSEGRKKVEQGVMLAYLLRLNRYALKKKLISKEIYRELERNMIKEYRVGTG